MSNADPKEEMPVEPSRFGKRFGRTIAVVLILFAALVAIGTISVGDTSSSQQPAPESSKKDFKF